MATVTAFEVPSPLGTLRCAATGAGLALVSFPDSDFETPLARLAPSSAVRRGEHAAADELREWFAGDRRAFDCALDLGAVSPFARTVLLALRDVPFGALVTYGELAARAGRPRAARAIGRIMGANPVSIVVP